MILVDTVVWSRHLRAADPALVALLRAGRVAVHPWIVGELALGPGIRSTVIDDLRALPTLRVVPDDDALAFVRLHGLRGIGWVDLHLLLACLSQQARLWTEEGGLRDAAGRFQVGHMQ